MAMHKPERMDWIMADKFDEVADVLMNGDHYLPTGAGNLTRKAVADMLRRELAGAVPGDTVAVPTFEPPVFIIKVPSSWGTNWYVGAQLEPGGAIEAAINEVSDAGAANRLRSDGVLAEIRRRIESRKVRGKDQGGEGNRRWFEEKADKYGPASNKVQKPVDPEEAAAKGNISNEAARQIGK